MNRRTTAIAAIIVLIAGFAMAADGTRWVNVNVSEKIDGTKIQVHLPLNLVLSVLKSVDVENFHHGRVDLDIDDVDMEVDWPELLAAVRTAPDGQFVTVDSPDAQVSVRKNGGTLLIDVTELDGENARIKVSLPMQFMDALVIDEESQIDVAALMASLESFPSGDIVTVSSDDADVRVWIE
jgi:invasion protein IalB